MSLTCRPALQAGTGFQQLRNRSRKGTSFLSTAGSLGQQSRREQRSKGEGGACVEPTEVPWPEACQGSVKT